MIETAIITHNAESRIENTIGALLNSGLGEEQIKIYDVASSDLTIDRIKNKYLGIKITSFKENLGPNPARNLAINEASTKYLFLIDDDVEVKENTIKLLFMELKDKSDVALVSPIVLYGNNKELIQYSNIKLHFLCEAINERQNTPYQNIDKNTFETNCITGCALLINTEIVKNIALFDEDFLFGKTDGDFSHRIKLAGYKILEVPQAVVYHHFRSRGKKRYTVQIVNRWQFIFKNYELKTIFLLLPIFIIHEIMQVVLLTILGQFGAYPKALKILFSNFYKYKAKRKEINLKRRVKDKYLLYSGDFIVPDKIYTIRLLKLSFNFYVRVLNFYWKIVV